MADQISVTDMAEHLGVFRMTLTRLLTGKIRRLHPSFALLQDPNDLLSLYRLFFMLRLPVQFTRETPGLTGRDYRK